MSYNQELPKSKHFRLEKLHEGVYAAIHQSEGWAISNAGIIDMGDRTLVFDTFRSPQPAIDLRIAAEELTGRPVTLVVNSHYHADHTWGNQVFHPCADIISSQETRKLIASKGIEQLHSLKENGLARLQTLESQYQDQEDAEERSQLAFWIAFFKGPVQALPIFKVTLPNITFVQDLIIHGSNRDVELINFIGGHTNSDTILYLPNEKIAFMGDLLWVGCHPNLIDCDPGEVERIQNQITSKRPDILVPGHGNIGTLTDLHMMADYLVVLERLARTIVQNGEGEEKIAEIPIPEEYATWELSTFFWGNLRKFIKRLSKF